MDGASIKKQLKIQGYTPTRGSISSDSLSTPPLHPFPPMLPLPPIYPFSSVSRVRRRACAVWRGSIGYWWMLICTSCQRAEHEEDRQAPGGVLEPEGRARGASPC
eukprot:scaffold9953_cov32-Tisochrysis_lutea.AAC.7